jgi:putative aldouronate transport system substrate-binding protein
LDAIDTDAILALLKKDGKLYGIHGGGEEYNTGLLWARKDWLDMCGLEIPNTLEEIANVAKVFAEQNPGGMDNTIGIAFNPYPGSMFGQWLGLLPLFNAYGSYPDIWIWDENGDAAYGSILPETKDALAQLAEWVEAGVLDKTMLTMQSGDEVRDTYISTGACGMYFNAWWDPWPQWNGFQSVSAIYDEMVEWVPVMAPLNADGQFKPKTESLLEGGQVVLSSYEHPEAVIRAMNFFEELNTFRNPVYGELIETYLDPIKGVTDYRTNSPFVIGMVTISSRVVAAEAVNNYLATDELVLHPILVGDAPRYIQGAYDWAKNGGIPAFYEIENPSDEQITEYMFPFVGHLAFDVVGNLYLNGEKDGSYAVQQRSFVGMTGSYEDYWTMLEDLRNTAFMQIIAGEKPLDYFDEFVSQWKSMGGDAITAEVNEAIG